MLLYTRLAPPKIPKKRSRADNPNVLTVASSENCRMQLLKCDEARPRCSRCEEQDQPCVYEAIKSRQRRRRESLSANTAYSTTQADVSANQWQQQQQQQLQQQLPRHGHRSQCREQKSPELWEMHTPTVNGTDCMPFRAPTPTRNVLEEMESLLPWAVYDTAALGALTPLTPASFDMHSVDGQSAMDGNEMNSDDVEEIIRRGSTAGSTMAPFEHAQLRCEQQDQFLPPLPTLEFCAPAFAEFSERKNRRHLVGHFCNVLTHLIVFREEYGNPFQQLVLPLSETSPVVMDTIYALSSAHLEFRGVQNIEKSEHFHGKAIQGLARLIEKGKSANRNELLAAIILLVYYEVVSETNLGRLVQKGRSNIVDEHLKGAISIMNNFEASTDPTSVFLERHDHEADLSSFLLPQAFRFYDVIAALSFGTAPLSSDSGSGSRIPLPPLDSRGATSPVGSVDTLLGMATALWPVIHRLSGLVCIRDKLEAAVVRGMTSEATVLRTELETAASAIQVALNRWQPILPPDDSRTPTDKARLQGILNNALAYRHSALVYLFRTIYGYEQSHALVQQNAHLSLVYCMGTAAGEGPKSALLWPLFVAACEATSTVDRDLARQAFQSIDRVQGMMNIERAWGIVREVWRRADADEALGASQQSHMAPGEVRRRTDGEMSRNITSGCGTKRGGDLWRRVSKDMGVTIVLG
ncbi:Pfam:DUF3468 [Geosmithia morbida]|uniref:Pfam:DUF3468 n=1 Tax=Geosmithia morbida TaxID=1094350 RepID=A0A9P4YPV0_9HYPO|nr:Pfam:DUF3468 [Geosmithia morbida]KAF4119533.1 Pfam:DUF3468 [Geosmithia morbida]